MILDTVSLVEVDARTWSQAFLLKPELPGSSVEDGGKSHSRTLSISSRFRHGVQIIWTPFAISLVRL